MLMSLSNDSSNIVSDMTVASQELGRESSAAQTTVGHALGTGSDLTRFDDRCSCALQRLPLPVQGVKYLLYIRYVESVFICVKCTLI
jgi:hypothetical protein